jgi:hypothetical protein
MVSESLRYNVLLPAVLVLRLTIPQPWATKPT